MAIRKLLALPGLVPVISVSPAAPALAEVCDKVRPDWSPAAGPVDQIGETVFIASVLVAEPTGWLLLALLLLSLLFRNRWLQFLTAALVAVVAVAISAELWIDDAISRLYRTAVAEGCRAPPILAVVLLISLSAWLLWRGLRRQPPKAHSPGDSET